MVVKIFVEGDNPDNAIFNTIRPERQHLMPFITSSSLETDFRKAFRILFSKHAKSDNIKIEVYSIGGIKQNKNKEFLIHSLKYKLSCLLIDLDTHKAGKAQQIENNWKEFESTQIFFFVQTMESWILSQPNVFITYFDNQKKRKNKEPIDITQYKYYYTQDFEDIEKPDDKLNEFIRYYWKEKYHKTKLAPKLIEKLSIHQLMEDFEDAKAMITYIFTTVKD